MKRRLSVPERSRARVRPGRITACRPVTLLGLMVLTMGAGCSDTPSTMPGAAPTSAPVSTEPATVQGAGTPGSVPPEPTAPTPLHGSKEVTTATVTLRVPISWQAQSTGSGDVFGPTIHVWRGYAIGRLNVMVFRGNIDDLAPQFCAGHGSVPGGIRGPSSVTLDERGFAPVGDRTAQYRQWTATCPNGPESHRAWVLPVTGLLFWETCSDSRIGPIVTNASVRTPIGVQSVDSPPPSTIPHNCDDTDLTDITTGP